MFKSNSTQNIQFETKLQAFSLQRSRFRKPLPISEEKKAPVDQPHNIPKTAPINPTNTPPSTTPNPYLDPSLDCIGDTLTEALVVGVGPVFPGVVVGVGPVFPDAVTVVSLTVCGPPGRTQEQVLLEEQADGPVVPVQVVVCPVHVTDAGQLVIVIMEVEVEVMVELG